MCTHRGGLNAMSTGGNPTVATRATAAPQISEFFQNRLAQIDAEIAQNEKWAALINSQYAGVRQKAKRAQARIDKLNAQYDQLLQAAQEDARIRAAVWAEE